MLVDMKENTLLVSTVVVSCFVVLCSSQQFLSDVKSHHLLGINQYYED